MARIALSADRSSDPDAAQVFDEIEGLSGEIPVPYRAFARVPHILQANWNRMKNIMSKGSLPIDIKEAIATRISKINGCDFNLELHKGNLAKLAVPMDEIEAIERGVVDDKKLSAVLDFVVKASIEPEKLTDEDFEVLKKLEFSEEEILEMLTVMELHTGFSKVLVALDIQKDA